MRFARLFACLLFLASLLPSVRAHQVASVELEFLKLDHEWRLLGEMDIAYMLPETRVIPDGLPLSREAVMKSPPEELARIRKETENTLRKLLRFTFAGKDVAWRIEFPDFEKQPFELPEEAGDIALLTTRLLIDPLPGAGELRIHWAGEQETELIILIEETEESENPQIISTLPGSSLMLLKQESSGAAAPIEKPVAGGFLESGFRHVIWWDHVLFILGLFLLAPQWKPLVRQSLLFTLAHSITLALSIFGFVRFPEVWIEHLVALSIAWIGVENLLLKRQLGKQRLIFVFCFGLLHGLSYAGILAEKLKGISGSGLVGPLLGFNLGVELAQIAILAVAFILIRPLKKYLLQVRIIGSAVIALMGSAWFIQRVFFPGSPLF
ncbi:HupE/UreJ family protein [Luteolibacter yonseiensis]|uniref:HupE/UreJ family protein n=1 Tax=Luteolibacter yonseiensis TaxID=1144680 RepID=A0A934VCM8_9BACT|nr:HupE/UreJ family protein [Luteolibacter yonseiensis]MBK1816654.1 HupE/UreJ family protein [Luteolibacter yonseiensis]